MNEQDKNDCLTILNELKEICVKFDYHDSKVAEFVYELDTGIRAVIEIIENKPLKIERMF